MERRFEMRLVCRYEQPENQVADLQVELLEDGAWRRLELSPTSPGFQVFVFSLFTCQHLYFRVNCIERGLVLESASGRILVRTDEHWDVLGVRVELEGCLRSGTPTQADLEYISRRMGRCPVSRNLKPVADTQTLVRLA